MDFSSPGFTRTEFTIVHSLEPNIRKKAFDFEDYLGDKYKAPFVVPIPDEITDYEAPRIIIESKHGYSKIWVFPTKIQLITSYDKHFSHDPEKVFNYFFNHSMELFNAFNKILAHTRVLYCGAVIDLKVDTNYGNVVNHLSDIFLKNKDNSKLFDINLRFAYPLDDLYFLNFYISNIREFNKKKTAAIDKSLIHSPSLSLFDKLRESISLRLDFNNRLEYNNKADYELRTERINNLFKILKKYSTENITEILERGIINVGSNSYN